MSNAAETRQIVTAIERVDNTLTNGVISQTIKIDQTTPGTTNGVVVNSGTLTTVTNPVQTKETPDATSTYSITPYISAAAEASSVIKASAGNLFGAYMVNTNVAVRYFQVFNSTTVPAEGTVPVLVFPVQPGSTFSFDTGKFSNYFTTGISVCNSSTLATKTIGTADSLFYVQYL